MSVQTHYLNRLLTELPSWNVGQQPFVQAQQSINQNQLLGYNFFSNPSELSPFNQNSINQNKAYNQGLLNESFENISLYDDSFHLHNNTINNIKDKFANDLDDENYDRLDEDEDVDEEEIDDVIEYEFLKNKKLTERNANHILKFYEEEEKSIEMEIKQDKKLLSVLNEEAKLTRQLSVEQLMHLNHQYEIIKKNSLKNTNENDENDDLAVRFFYLKKDLKNY